MLVKLKMLIVLDTLNHAQKIQQLIYYLQKFEMFDPSLVMDERRRAERKDGEEKDGVEYPQEV